MEAREPKENKDFTGIQGDGSKFAAPKSSSMLLFIIQKFEGKVKVRTLDD